MAPADLEQYLSPQMKSGHLSEPDFKLIPSTPQTRSLVLVQLWTRAHGCGGWDRGAAAFV
jgi:hypothetical protein